MNMFKKLSAAFCCTLLMLNCFAVEQPKDSASGKIKMLYIMSNDETGIAAFNKAHVNCANTQNLSNDILIPEIAKYFACNTVMGESFLTQTLQVPLSPQDRETTLANRQHAIRTLINNPALKSEVETLLKEAAQDEQDVIILLSDLFKGKSCPELAKLEALKKQSQTMYNISKFVTFNPTGSTIKLAYNAFGIASMSLATVFAGKLAYRMEQAGLDYSKLAIYTGYLGLASVVCSYVQYKDYSAAAAKRKKMHALSDLVRIAERFEELCRQYDITNQFNISEITDKNGCALINGLRSSRYQAKNSIVFATPLVHTFLYKIYDQEKSLAPLFACIAEMDAYNAIATKMIAAQDKQDSFCFTNFIASDKPAISSSACWNVLVDRAVANDLSTNKHIILTGPNAGGKSTMIRTVLQNIILGQSFGVAAAHTFDFTMFDVIHSYLNISDDLVNGLSLFASEVKRAQDILQKMKTLSPDSKFFFALDELFTGTASENGEICAQKFIENIAAYNHVLFIYATHFNKLKELGRDNAYCTNYKVDAPTKDANGKLVYPFTLSLGASDVNVALDIARQANLFI